MRNGSPPRTRTSSSSTAFTTCWAGDRLRLSSAPTRRERTPSTSERATARSASASMRAARICASASSTSASFSVPRLRRRPKMPARRLESESNTGLSGEVQEGPDEFRRRERDEVVGPLADADELHRDPEVALHGDDDAPFCGAVELGQHDAGHPHGVEELAGLDETVLPGGGIEHEEHLGHLARGAFGHPPDLLELLDQVHLGVEATR